MFAGIEVLPCWHVVDEMGFWDGISRCATVGGIGLNRMFDGVIFLGRNVRGATECWDWGCYVISLRVGCL